MTPIDLRDIRCAAYIRVSTERQAGEVQTSLADQRAAIERAAAQRQLAVGAWFEDAGASGGSANRPAFLALVAACEAAPRTAADPGLILALNDSRWGRWADPEMGTYWRKHLERFHWSVRFAEGDDIEDATARGVLRVIGQAQAGAYRQQIRANATRGAYGTAAQGYWQSSAPLGYKRAVVFPAGRERILEHGVPKAKDEKLKLAIVEDEAVIVRQLFARYANGGESLYSLLQWIRTVSTARKWSVTRIRWMLKNPAYVGDVVIGRRRAEDSAQGTRQVAQPRETWLVVADAHPAIVDRELFARVQRRLTANAERPRAVTSEYLLTGIVTCGVCGAPLVGGGVQVNGSGKRAGRRYRCREVTVKSRVRESHGPGGHVRQRLLDDAVLGALTDIFTSPRLQAKIRARLEALVRTPPDDDTRQRLTAERAQLEQRQTRLVHAIADNILAPSEAAPQLRELRQSLAQNADALRRLRPAADRASAMRAEGERMLGLLTQLPAVLRQLTIAQQRAIIAPWIQSATYYAKDRTVLLRIGTPGDGEGITDSIPRQAPHKNSPPYGKKVAPIAVRRVKVAGGTR